MLFLAVGTSESSRLTVAEVDVEEIFLDEVLRARFDLISLLRKLLKKETCC